MRFFIPLGFQYGKDADNGQVGQPVHPYYHLGSVYGPYDSDGDVQEALARLWPNDKDKQFLIFTGDIIGVPASALEKSESEKRAPGDFANYREAGAGYVCKDCGADIIAVQVAHPVHAKEMPGAGFGECQYTDAPYCPSCERKPSSSGAPVYESVKGLLQ